EAEPAYAIRKHRTVWRNRFHFDLMNRSIKGRQKILSIENLHVSLMLPNTFVQEIVDPNHPFILGEHLYEVEFIFENIPKRTSRLTRDHRPKDLPDGKDVKSWLDFLQSPAVRPCRHVMLSSDALVCFCGTRSVTEIKS